MQTKAAWVKDYIRRVREDFERQSPISQIGHVKTVVSLIFGAIVVAAGWAWTQIGTETRAPSSTAELTKAPPAPPIVQISREPQPSILPMETSRPNLPPEGMATRVGVWITIDRRMDELSRLLNRGYLLLDNWIANFRSDRSKEMKDLESLSRDFSNFRASVDQFKNLYSDDQAISAALRPVELQPGRHSPPYPIFYGLTHSIDTFSEALRQFSDPAPDDIESQMYAYTGAFKMRLDSVRDWQSQVRQISSEQKQALAKTQARSQ